jgi:hypothetical protein
MNPSIIGENENIMSPEFIQRPPNPPYTANCPTYNYQWAEIKSSLLVQELYNDNETHKILVTFLQGIVIRVCKILNINYLEEIQKYLKDYPKNNTNSYPVSQTHAFLGINPLSPDGLWNDFYALWNFIKWIWIGIYNNTYYKPDSTWGTVLLYCLLHIFQQKTAVFIEMAKGRRLTNPERHDSVKDDHIGISNIQIPELLRNIHNKPSFSREPWIHPGQQRCKVPYHGKYGTYIKDYKEQNDFYASLQCGISGSTQFILYMYLFSIATPNQKQITPEQIQNDIRNVITTAVLILTGDGGHNVREIISGLVITIIILYNIIQEIPVELQEIYSNELSLIDNIAQFKTRTYNSMFFTNTMTGSIIKFISNKLPSHFYHLTQGNPLASNKIVTEFVLKILDGWTPFISSFYEETTDMNILGVQRSDLDSMFIDQLDIRKQQMFNTFCNLVNSDYVTEDIIKSGYFTIQLFFTLENNRHTLDITKSFKTASNDKLKYFIKKFPNGKILLKSVTKKLKSLIHKCNAVDTKVPFAFSN